VVGASLRRLRTGASVTLDRLSVVAKQHGLKWTNSRVSAVERGEVPFTVETLYLLAQTLTAATGQPVSLPDLLRTESDGDQVALSAEYSVPVAELVAFASGQPVNPEAAGSAGDEALSLLLAAKGPHGRLKNEWLEDERLLDVLRSSGLAEERAAKDLGLTRLELALVSVELFGRSLSAERDARSPGASPQKRGTVAVALKQEIRGHLEAK
jgi:transcriptional regulator with XRE-family HTH domain